MTRKASKAVNRRVSHQNIYPAGASKSAEIHRPHIFLNDPNVQEVKRALSPFWAWRIER